jgi:hypothetical protein
LWVVEGEGVTRRVGGTRLVFASFTSKPIPTSADQAAVDSLALSASIYIPTFLHGVYQCRANSFCRKTVFKVGEVTQSS